MVLLNKKLFLAIAYNSPLIIDINLHYLIMAKIKYYLGEELPLEMHKVRMVQRLNLVPIERRKEAIEEAGNNTFLLFNKDIYLDMLTDSGVNAMSDNQTASMLTVDDSYAGSATYTRPKDKIKEIFDKDYFLQKPACTTRNTNRIA